jgi:hypothetical protein
MRTPSPVVVVAVVSLNADSVEAAVVAEEIVDMGC